MTEQFTCRNVRYDPSAMPTSRSSGLTNTASELRLVLGQLIRKLRSENAVSISHLAVLSRLDRGGPQTTSGLAAAERMRPQSMAQTVVDLHKDGLVERRPDADDRRQILIDVTDQGRELLAEMRQRREDWLSRAIDNELSPAEQDVLAQSVVLLRRLAEL
jgi:DNA-binding MarR family transcriptional regulator